MHILIFKKKIYWAPVVQRSGYRNFPNLLEKSAFQMQSQDWALAYEEDNPPNTLM